MTSHVQELADEILKNHLPNRYQFVLTEVLLPETEEGITRAKCAYQRLLDDGFVEVAPSTVVRSIVACGTVPQTSFKLTPNGEARRETLLAANGAE